MKRLHRIYPNRPRIDAIWSFSSAEWWFWIWMSCKPSRAPHCSTSSPGTESGDFIKSNENQRLLIKTKHFDCRPALDPSRILQGEILRRFWKILEDFWREILPKSCKMLINLDLGRLRALKITSNRIRDLRDLQKISRGENATKDPKKSKSFWLRWTHRKQCSGSN